MTIENTAYQVVTHPLLWWLSSVAIVAWVVLVIKVDDRPRWYDRWFILALLVSSALIGGDFVWSLMTSLTAGLQSLFSIKLILDGGKATTGAILGAAIVVLIYLRIRKLPIMRYADKLVPFAALAYGVARIGCFANGDDFGVPTELPWAVEFPSGTMAYEAHLYRGWIDSGMMHSLAVHPVQLYHALAGFLGFMFLRSWTPRYDGGRFALAWVYYGVTRFIIEFYRDDYWIQNNSIDMAQWFSLLFVVIGFVLWLFSRPQKSREGVIVAG